MIDNEYVFELDEKQASLLNVVGLLRLLDLNQGYFKHIRAFNSPILQEIGAKFGGSLLGISMFKLLPMEHSKTEAHVDKSLTPGSVSRDCAINVVVGFQESIVECWSEDHVEVREHGYSKDYALRFYPCEKNRMVFSMVANRPYLLNTNRPHLGYSKPDGGLLLSLGFTKPFEEMKDFLKSL